MTEASHRTSVLDLSFVRRGGRTVIDRRIFGWPFVLARTFHLERARPDLLDVVVQTSSSSLNRGDRLSQRLVLGADTAVHVATQGATAVYRAGDGPGVKEDVHLVIGAGACLEYTPEPRILFPHSALHQSLQLDCAPDGAALLLDSFTMHDPSGGDLGFRELEGTLQVRREDQLVLFDRLHLKQPAAPVFGAHRAFATATLIAPRAAGHTAAIAALTDRLSKIQGLYAGVSSLPSATGIGVRLAATDLRPLRLAFEHIRDEFRRLAWRLDAATTSPPAEDRHLVSA